MSLKVSPCHMLHLQAEFISETFRKKQLLHSPFFKTVIIILGNI